MLGEEGGAATAAAIAEGMPEVAADVDILGNMIEDGLLEYHDGLYTLTEDGRKRAESIIRRHRLAERLLVDVLNIQEVSLESEACTFEHFLSPEVTDHICTLLGHPKNCPHGLAIPRGPCCKRAEKRIETAVVPLGELAPGEDGRIVYISTQRHERLDRLTALGLFPGRVVRVHQKEPLLVVVLDETQLALEKSIGAEIFVIRS
jgi:DtxR family Mn-dependent transcriptional regulator